MHLIHITARDLDVIPLYDTPRNTHDGTVWRNLLEHDTAGSNLGILAHGKGTDDLGSRTDHDVIANRWVTLAGLLSGTSQGYTLIQGYIISHDRGLSDDDAASMVDKKSLADGGTGWISIPVFLAARCEIARARK